MSLAAEDARPLSLSLSYLPPNAEMNGWHGKEWADSMLRCGLRLDYLTLTMGFKRESAEFETIGRLPWI